MDFNLNWIYFGISWMLLRWHDVWSWLFRPDADITWVLSIVFVVLTVRTILIPVVVKQIKSQRAMQALQPKMTELRAKYKHDPQTLRIEMAKLVQEEKANPLMGCLPLLLQTPVLIGLFHVLRCINPLSEKSKTAMTEQYGWTLAQFHSVTGAKLFGAPIAASFNSPSNILNELGTHRGNVRLVAGLLVLMMVATTYITQRQMIARSGGAAEGSQAIIQKLMLYGIPATLLVSGFIFPIGVLIYWVVTNLFSMVQQHMILKKMPPPPRPGAKSKPVIDATAAKKLAPKPGVKPVKARKPGGNSAAGATKTKVRSEAELAAVSDSAKNRSSTKSSAPQPRKKKAAAPQQSEPSAAATSDKSAEKSAEKTGEKAASGSGSGRSGGGSKKRNRKRKGGRN